MTFNPDVDDKRPAVADHELVSFGYHDEATEKHSVPAERADWTLL